MIASTETSVRAVRVNDLVARLVAHPLYERIRDEDTLRRFMRSHVFCVWDFMSLLKALQRHLTCIEVPWVPSVDPESRRLINEIVLDEESDDLPDDRYLSHFELYLHAMAQCGADTGPITRLLAALRRGTPVEEALARPDLPDGVAEFVAHTLRVAGSGEIHRIAASFTYGREDVIPAMFQEMVQRLAEKDGKRWSLFLLYLNRHIEHDGDRHAPMSLALVRQLCGDSPRLWAEAQETARESLQVRINLWDRLADQV
jgi:hypothetical protein